jgi:serpin B
LWVLSRTIDQIREPDPGLARLNYMKALRRPTIFLAGLALLAAACGSDAGVVTSTPPPTAPVTFSPSVTGTDGTDPAIGYDPTAGFVRADIARTASTDVTDDELAALVEGNDAFAFGLFRAAAADQNLIVSPYSIATALTMTLAGARGTTAEEIRTTLHLQLLEDRIHAARNELDLRITDVPEPGPEDEREPFAIRTANSIWGQPGYPFLDAFLELLAADYDAGLRLADFTADPETARVTINEWVEEQTEGRIVDLIPAGALDPMTRLVLVNAIWFKANWDEPFDPDLTTNQPFTLLDGSIVDVPMMLSPDQPLRVGEDDGYLAVSIPYAGDASMLVIVPDSGTFGDVTTELGAEELAALDAAMASRPVRLTLPSFEIRSDLGLNDLLQSLGMEAAFVPPPGDGSADFTGITELRELYVSDVVHQAFIKVDEEGTEAAAATAVVMRATSAPLDEPLSITVDRPFLFLIRHDTTGEILFMGQVTNPAA